MIRFAGNSLEGSMGKPYSLDLRERVVRALEGGLSTDQAAKRFASQQPIFGWMFKK